MSEKENMTDGGFVPLYGDWFSIEAERRQADALERIATALEVIAYSDLRGEGFDDRGHLTKAAIAHFKEARDA